MDSISTSLRGEVDRAHVVGTADAQHDSPQHFDGSTAFELVDPYSDSFDWLASDAEPSFPAGMSGRSDAAIPPVGRQPTSELEPIEDVADAVGPLLHRYGDYGEELSPRGSID